MILRFCNKFLTPTVFNCSLRQPIILSFSMSTKNDAVKGTKKKRSGKAAQSNIDSIKLPNIDVPRDFFDDNVEEDKEFLDVAAALESPGGLEQLTTVKEPLSWQELDDDTYRPSTFSQEYRKAFEAASLNGDFDDHDTDDDDLTPSESFVANALCTEDLGKQLDNLPSSTFIPPEVLNYTVPWRMTEAFPEPMLENFVPNTSREKFRYDKQGLRACPGGLQRRGKRGDLGCHLVDLDDLHYLDVLALRRFISDDSEIMSRKLTGLCSKCQRNVASTIKRARHLGLVPHIGEYTLQDSRPLHAGSRFHDPMNTHGTVESKSII